VFIIRVIQKFQIKFENKNEKIEILPSSFLFNAVPKVVLFEKLKN
jgi:hypothetical protein